MIDLPLTAFAPERVEASDAIYAAIGRALSLATRFDAHCGVVSTFIALRSNVPSRQKLASLFAKGNAVGALTPKVHDEVDKLLKTLRGNTLHAAIEKIIAALNMTSDEVKTFDIRLVLKRGNEARNEIAHDITKALDDTRDPSDTDLLEQLKDCVTRLAHADFFVSLLIDLLNGDPPPRGKFLVVLNTYVDRLVDWVCDVEAK